MLIAGALLLPAPARPSLPPPIDRAEEDLVLLAVVLDQNVLSEGIAVYPAGDGLLLPLGELCELLHIAIAVDPGRGVAEGFIERESDRFRLDLDGQRVDVGGRDQTIPAESVERHADDIFVEAGQLSRWLPIDFRTDYQAATLVVLPRQPLAIQERWARENRAMAGLEGADGDGVPRVPNPHRFFDGAAIDQTVRMVTVPRGPGDRLTTAHYSTFLAMDALWFENDLYLSGSSQDAVTESRLSAGRRDPRARLLGPLHARQLGFMEVYQPGIDLLTVGGSGPGAQISSYPLSRPTQFDRHTLRGDLQSGWEVELFRNEALIGYQRAGDGGRYEFADVPLAFGVNTLRLVFHGPQGQRREETRIFNIGQSLTPPGRLYYRIGWNDPRTLEARTTAEIDLGLTPHLSTAIRLAETKSGGGGRYGLFGLRAWEGRFLTTLDGAVKEGSGAVAQGLLSMRLGSAGILVRHAALRDFRSEYFAGGAPGLLSRSVARFEGSLRTPGAVRLALAVEGQRDRFAAGRWLDRVEPRLSLAWHGFTGSNTIRWSQETNHGSAPARTADGFFLAGRNWLRTSLRVEGSYDLDPDRRMRAVGLSGERRLGGLSVSATVERRLDVTSWRPSLSISRGDGPVAFGLRASHAGAEGVTASLQMSLGLSRDPRSGRWHSTARSTTASGMASARVFLDRNANGLADPGEPPLTGVAFTVNGANRPVESGADGLAFLGDMPANEETRLSVNPETLEDPQWVARQPAIRFVPRPGQVARIDFPVFVGGEITGTVTRRANGRIREVPGLAVTLMRIDTGEIVARTRSAYDGFYDLADIPPGRYLVALSAAGCARLNLPVPAARPVEITTTGTTLDGLDFVLAAPPAGSPVLAAD